MKIHKGSIDFYQTENGDVDIYVNGYFVIGGFGDLDEAEGYYERNKVDPFDYDDGDEDDE